LSFEFQLSGLVCSTKSVISSLCSVVNNFNLVYFDISNPWDLKSEMTFANNRMNRISGETEFPQQNRIWKLEFNAVNRFNKLSLLTVES